MGKAEGRQHWLQVLLLATYARPPERHEQQELCIIVAEELLLISLAAVSAIYGVTLAPLFVLTWGFCIHLLVQIVLALAIKGYIPGLITSVLLLPYAGVAVSDMIQQLSWQQNLLYAVSGTTIVYLNQKLMHMIFNK